MDIEVKLQGGPAHGKVTRTHTREVIINTVEANPRTLWSWESDYNATFDVRTSRYQMLVIQNPLDPMGPRIPCMTPKGQAIYKYVKEKV